MTPRRAAETVRARRRERVGGFGDAADVPPMRARTPPYAWAAPVPATASPAEPPARSVSATRTSPADRLRASPRSRLTEVAVREGASNRLREGADDTRVGVELDHELEPAGGLQALERTRDMSAQGIRRPTGPQRRPHDYRIAEIRGRSRGSLASSTTTRRSPSGSSWRWSSPSSDARRETSRAPGPTGMRARTRHHRREHRSASGAVGLPGGAPARSLDVATCPRQPCRATCLALRRGRTQKQRYTSRPRNGSGRVSVT